MSLTRREFLALTGALGFGSCAGRFPKLTEGLRIGRGERFTFAAVNDTHVKDARSAAIVNRAVQMINSKADVRFTVILGDIATDGQLAELQLAKISFDNLIQPYWAIPGNHDVEPKSLDIYANYRRFFGPRHWTQACGGWVFMGIDSCDNTKSDVAIQPAEMEWIRKQLKKVHRSRPIAVFAHHPFNPSTKKYRVANADDVLALFQNHSLKLVASGHYHGNQVEEKDGVLFTTTACCSSTRDNFDRTTAKGFRLFHIIEDRIETEFVTVAG